MKIIYDSLGIIHQTSCSYTLTECNVERKHRHLLETARALMFHSKVPTEFWGDCVTCAAYLINRMTLKRLQYVTPYEEMFSKPPLVEHLKTFVCLCYVSTVKAHRTKFDPKAPPGVFLGYSITQKDYKVFNLSIQQVIVYRDIVFHERHFPFHIQSQITIGVAEPIFVPAATCDVFNEDYPSSFSVSIRQPSSSTSSVHNDYTFLFSDSSPSDLNIP